MAYCQELADREGCGDDTIRRSAARRRSENAADGAPVGAAIRKDRPLEGRLRRPARHPPLFLFDANGKHPKRVMARIGNTQSALAATQAIPAPQTIRAMTRATFHPPLEGEGRLTSRAKSGGVG